MQPYIDRSKNEDDKIEYSIHGLTYEQARSLIMRSLYVDIISNALENGKIPEEHIFSKQLFNSLKQMEIENAKDKD